MTTFVGFLIYGFSFYYSRSHRTLFRFMEYSSQCLASELERREKKLTGSPGTIKFPALFIIHSSYYKCWFAAQIKHGERVDHFRTGQFRIDLFTVVCLFTWPLNESEAGGDLVMIETSLFLLCKFLLISMRTASLT